MCTYVVMQIFYYITEFLVRPDPEEQNPSCHTWELLLDYAKNLELIFRLILSIV